MATPTKTPIKNRVRPATDAGKADMASVVFHELGNQLGIISGLSELLAQTPLSEEQQTLIEAVRQSAEVMRQLAADFRMVHELEDRAFPLNVKPFDLTLLAEHLALVAQLEADRKGLQVEVIVDERIPAKMIADPLRIHQVVANLLNNALKYTKKGAIRLEWSCLALTAGRLSLRTTVTDSGIGIPESELATIFDWHYRVAGSDVAGSGIGLALARRLVGEMGSELHVRSAPGQGTTFWFDLELPVWPAPPTPAAAAPLPFCRKRQNFRYWSSTIIASTNCWCRHSWSGGGPKCGSTTPEPGMKRSGCCATRRSIWCCSTCICP